MRQIFEKRRLEKNADHLQYEFLPSALEIAERPASPMGHGIIYLISIIMLTFILWASFSKVDEVAVSRGTIVPDGRIKVVQNFEEGIISKIYVEEGQRVEKGDLLLDLDTAMKEVDKEAIEEDIKVLRIEKSLLEASLDDRLDGNKIIDEIRIGDEKKADLIALDKTRRESYAAKQELLNTSIVEAEANLEKEEKELEKLQSKLSIATENHKLSSEIVNTSNSESISLETLAAKIEVLKAEEKGHKELYESGLLSEKEYLDKKNELEMAKKDYDLFSAKRTEEKQRNHLKNKEIEDEATVLRNDIALEEVRIKQATNEVEKARENLKIYEKDYRNEILDEIIKKQKEIDDLRSSLEKYEKSMSYQKVCSPVSGYVQGVSEFSVGSVLKPADRIMKIVPDDTPLIVEAIVENRDIGYIEVGQKASIKVDTFSFQKYGLIDARVMQISPDAVYDERNGLVYKIKLGLEKEKMTVRGKEVRLSSGMTVSAEIKTGERRIIAFLLEPLVKHLSEAFTLR